LLLLVLLQEKRAGVGPVTNPNGNDSWGERGFCIQEEDMFQLILTFEGGFREGIIKRVTSQGKGSSCIRNRSQESLGRTTLGLIQDHRAETSPRRD